MAPPSTVPAKKNLAPWPLHHYLSKLEGGGGGGGAGGGGARRQGPGPAAPPPPRCVHQHHLNTAHRTRNEQLKGL